MKTFLSMLTLLSMAVFLCCSNDASKEIAVIEEDAELIEVRSIAASNPYPNYLITMRHTDENIVFKCNVDNGLLGNPEGSNVSKNLNAHSGDQILWTGSEPLNNGQLFRQAFIEIVLKVEQNNIGYVVSEINVSANEVSNSVIKSVLFPRINGKYQNISEEYIKTKIEKVKAQVKR